MAEFFLSSGARVLISLDHIPPPSSRQNHSFAPSLRTSPVVYSRRRIGVLGLVACGAVTLRITVGPEIEAADERIASTSACGFGWTCRCDIVIEASRGGDWARLDEVRLLSRMGFDFTALLREANWTSRHPTSWPGTEVT